MAQAVQPTQILATPTKVTQAQQATAVQQAPQQQQPQVLGQAQVKFIDVFSTP